MVDTRPPLDPIFRAFGVTASVNVPGRGPEVVQVISGFRTATYPGAGELTTTERLRTIAIRRTPALKVVRGAEVIIGTERLEIESVIEDDDEIVVAVVR
jgi:hypothetical protein